MPGILWHQYCDAVVAQIFDASRNAHAPSPSIRFLFFIFYIIRFGTTHRFRLKMSVLHEKNIWWETQILTYSNVGQVHIGFAVRAGYCGIQSPLPALIEFRLSTGFSYAMSSGCFTWFHLVSFLVLVLVLSLFCPVVVASFSSPWVRGGDRIMTPVWCTTLCVPKIKPKVPRISSCRLFHCSVTTI